jgi:hypothetical protein
MHRVRGRACVSSARLVLRKREAISSTFPLICAEARDQQNDSASILKFEDKEMKVLNNFRMIMTMFILTTSLAARAAEVTVNFQTVPWQTSPPKSTTLDTNVIGAGCENATADTFSGYQFLFWDNQGTIAFTPTVEICVGSSNSTATAWYEATGGGPCAATGCAISTFAFSIDHDEFLEAGTAIALVSPDSPEVWTPGSTSVITQDGPEAVSAFSTLAFPPYAAEPFRFWQVLGTTTETPIGIVYNAAQGSSAYVAAFYGPDPCQADRNELQSCLEGPGPHGPLNCSGFGKVLQACEKLNRESN